MTKAYMSDQTDSEELRFCLRQGRDAGAELAKILAKTEPSAAGDLGPLPYSLKSVERDALRDALSALVADGGPLDELAWLSLRTVEDSREGGDLWATVQRTYLANAARYDGARA